MALPKFWNLQEIKILNQDKETKRIQNYQIQNKQGH